MADEPTPTQVVFGQLENVTAPLASLVTAWSNTEGVTMVCLELRTVHGNLHFYLDENHARALSENLHRTAEGIAAAQPPKLSLATLSDVRALEQEKRQ